MQVTEMVKKVMGAEHPFTLTSMNNLAYVFKNNGCKDGAIKLTKTIFCLWGEKLGPDHPYIKDSVFILVSCAQP